MSFYIFSCILRAAYSFRFFLSQGMTQSVFYSNILDKTFTRFFLLPLLKEERKTTSCNIITTAANIARGSITKKKAYRAPVVVSPSLFLTRCCLPLDAAAASLYSLYRSSNNKDIRRSKAPRSSSRVVKGNKKWAAGILKCNCI